MVPVTPNTPRIRQVLDDIDGLIDSLKPLGLTQDEFIGFYRTLNQRAVDFFKKLQRDTRKKFKRGDLVEIDMRDGRTIVAIVMKINPKTIKIRAKDGHGEWAVTPTLLRPHSVVERIAELGNA